MKEINVVIEISYRSNIKYELDKEKGRLSIDRILHTSMVYPGNYGFIENTLAKDGDPLDVLVLSEYKFLPGCCVKVKPLGVISMEDEKGVDEKIIAVVSDKIDRKSVGINDIKDLPVQTIREIEHFFEHYKDLEEGKYVKISGHEGVKAALDIIDSYTLK